MDEKRRLGALRADELAWREQSLNTTRRLSDFDPSKIVTSEYQFKRESWILSALLHLIGMIGLGICWGLYYLTGGK